MRTKVFALGRRTRFSAAFRISDLASTANCTCCLFAVRAAQSCVQGGDTLNDGVAHYPIDSGAFNPGYSCRWATFHNHEFAHSPSMKMFAPVWADWTRLGWNVTAPVHIVQLSQHK